MREDRLLELDALRGIAAMMVVLFHLTMNTAIEKFGFRYGVTGVDLFFIISGFVIFLTLNKSRRCASTSARVNLIAVACIDTLSSRLSCILCTPS